MTRITSGVNACCYQPYSLWRYRKCHSFVSRTFPRVIEPYCFHKITKDTQLPQIFGHMPFIKQKNKKCYQLGYVHLAGISIQRKYLNGYLRWTLYQKDGHNVIDIISCYFHLIKGICPKMCGNWVSVVIIWYQLSYSRTKTRNLHIFLIDISDFTSCFAFGIFILFCTNRVVISY